MERKQNNELALVKAAAWAWYQRGSGSVDGNSMREFDATGRSSEPPSSYSPSRYKLEVMRNNASPTTTRDFNSLLLDSYEIESVSKELNHLIDHFSGIKVYNKFEGAAKENGDHDYRKNYYRSSYIGDSSSSSSMGKKKSNSHLLKGLLRRHAVVCGRSQDVDDSSTVLRRRRRPEN